jgi:hypothetical protein
MTETSFAEIAASLKAAHVHVNEMTHLLLNDEPYWLNSTAEDLWAAFKRRLEFAGAPPLASPPEAPPLDS